VTVKVIGIDHIVLCVADVRRTIDFYAGALGMEPREERPGKWSLHFGRNKISVQDARSAPEIARETVPGSGNFCVLTDEPVASLAEALRRRGIEIVAGPAERDGAVGKLLSIYFRDPDGNLVEVANDRSGVADRAGEASDLARDHKGHALSRAGSGTKPSTRAPFRG
jgi:catechol 2,3-dioxygenase-like lactoylglutathione lyase family enzyme